MPHTTRTQFTKTESEGLHYKKVEQETFDEWINDGLLLLRQSIEEGVDHTDEETKKHTSNPVINVDRWQKACGTARYRKHTMHTWKQSGILVSDVQKIINNHKVALIECELQEAIRMLHYREEQERLAINYIYLQPPSVEELECRLIRQGNETMDSIRHKKGKMIQDMAALEGLDWVNKVFVIHNQEELMKEVPVHVIHKLYKNFL